MQEFSVYGFLGSIYRVTKTSSKAASYAGKLLWSHTLKLCFSWGHLNTVWRETGVDSTAQSKRLSAFLISGLLCLSLVLRYKPKWHVSVMSGTKMMLQFVLLFITPLLTAAEAWHGGPWNSCTRKTATPQPSITSFKFSLENIWKDIDLTYIVKQRVVSLMSLLDNHEINQEKHIYFTGHFNRVTTELDAATSGIMSCKSKWKHVSERS